jgi:hypothetical protein
MEIYGRIDRGSRTGRKPGYQVFKVGTFVPCTKLYSEKKSVVADYLGTPIHGYDKKSALVWEQELDCYSAMRKLSQENNFCNYLYQG